MASLVSQASLVKGGLAGLVAAVVGAGSQLLLVVAVTRTYDAHTAGTLFTATTLCLMTAGVLKLDSGNALIYFIARSHRPALISSDISRYFRVALLPVSVLSLLTGTAVLLYADGLATVTLPGHETSGLATALRTLAVALPVLVCADVLVSATRGFGVMRPTALLTGVLQPGGQLVLVGLLALAGVTADPLQALCVAWALPALPVLVLATVWLRRRLRLPAPAAVPPRDLADRTRPALSASPPHHLAAPGCPVPGAFPPRRHASAAPRPSGTARLRPRPAVPDAAREFWRYAAPRALGGAVQAIFQRLDIVIVAVLAGPEHAALYTAATRFKVVGQLVNQGLAQAVHPRLVRAMANGDLPLARRLYQTTTMWLVVVTWPIWLGYAALAPWLLAVFGDGYRDGAAVAVVLALTMAVATACGMVDVVLIAAGHTASSMANILTATAVTVALDLALVPAHGALGAALGWSGGVVAKNLLPLLQMARRYGLRPFGAHSLSALRAWRPEEAA
ncbi:oligosaccharide flippase family protein [Sphaerisporangium fuscum]|uniref:oligosaccharide flippase family protein n=1 Tax=Sphaerisporangium fuscum TaxID=2835868 RepID=UPI0027E397C9|nr:oligosaccharide flippase family protein [Sphaerisporangium fuscum]